MSEILTDDYKLYLDEKFKGMSTLMNAHYLAIDSNVTKIESEIDETNKRVTELEKAECPVAKELKDYKIQMADVNFFSNHPKLGIGIISFFVITFLFTVYLSISQFQTRTKSNLIQTTQIMQQADSISLKNNNKN